MYENIGTMITGLYIFCYGNSSLVKADQIGIVPNILEE